MATKVKAPNGFSFRVHKSGSTVLVALHKNGVKELIGRVTLVRVKPRIYETHSWLDQMFRNKGFGTLIYAKAIQWGLDHDFRVRSSSGTSEEAQRVWNGKGLRKFFSLRKRTIHLYGDVRPKWYAYSV